MKKVSIQKAQYCGGLPDSKGSKNTSNLWATDEGIGHGAFGPKFLIPWADVASVSFDSGTAAKSRKGKAVMFGVFALAAKNTQSAADVTILLKDGNVALYRILGKSGHQVRGKLQPFLTAQGVACPDDAATVPSPTPPTPAVASTSSVADELGKLAELHRSGALTDEEFAAHKAKLL